MRSLFLSYSPPPEFPYLNSKKIPVWVLFVCFTLQSKWFTLLSGLVTELHKERDMKLLGEREDTEEDSKYLVRGGKG